MASAYVGTLPVGGWKPEDKPDHLLPLLKKYNDVSVGFEAMNHLNPDVKIGLDLGWGGLLQKIRYYRTFNAPTEADFYGRKTRCWACKPFAAARGPGARWRQPKPAEIAANLLAIADCNAWLVDPPRTRCVSHYSSRTSNPSTACTFWAAAMARSTPCSTRTTWPTSRPA
jgi:hypothetical protein